MPRSPIAKPMNPFQLFPSGTKDYFSERVAPLVATPIKVYDFTGQVRRSIIFIHWLNCLLLGGSATRSGLQIAQFYIDDAGVVTQFAGSPLEEMLIVVGTAPVIDYVITDTTITVQANMALIANEGIVDVETLVKNIDIPVPPPPI